MLAEVIQGLRVEPGKKYIDATVGGGGHLVEILKLGGVVLGIDQDKEAIDYTSEIFKENKDWKLIQGNFRDIEHIAKEHGFESVSGILFDLGVSSHQLDTPERGFSYRFTNAPLDLRLDQSKGETAAQLVNRIGEGELYDLFVRFAEEELARPIAHAIFIARAVSPIETTGDLVAAIETVTQDQRRRSAVLSRVFQALRIAVNDELGALKEGLGGAKELLEQNGRLVVLTFHSLEDRVVKQVIRGDGWQRVTKKAITPTEEEMYANVRARSAKLRIAEKL